MYYYQTDLRTAALGNCTSSTTGADVCEDNVEARGADNATHQRMTTFTLGLGVSGTLRYHANYQGGMSGDFNAVEAGPTNWPIPGDGFGAANIDDLWHAAVNGRGQYFSAGDPDSLATGLSGALTAIKQRTGTAAAAATTTLQPVPGDNTEFVTEYTTLKWTGDLVAYEVDPATGARATSSKWSASARLDTRVVANIPRAIYYMTRSGSANTGTLRDFTFANLDTDGFGGHFQNVCSKSLPLSQCTSSGFDVTGANLGANVVNWLRGNADSRYRSRDHVLSDTVGGAPVYVGKPRFQYLENGYQTFATSNASRAGMVYVPSNGGMLHAFRASDGQEEWAFVPSMVMDRMYRLADNDYASKHEYFVNATPVIGDVWVPALNAWRTILVGGLGAGGRGYYALDVTDPANPQALWEFTNDSLGGNDNLGLTFGNPVITKRADGTWVVMFTSGYNNVSPGDGNGRLFVVDARTGQRLDEIETFTSAGVKAGTTTAPSGLGKINAWVESQTDNTTLRVYGGDFLGSVWRFDIDNRVQPNHAALRLAYLRDGTKAQPITTRPELVNVPSGGASHAVVYVGTGVMLRTNDLADAGVQSVYAIKDSLTNTPLGDLRARTDVVEQTLTIAGSDSRTVTNHPVDWSVKNGWRVDLPTSGERVNIDMRLALSTLVVGTNAPATLGICSESGGQSFLYKFDFMNGSSLPGSGGTVGISLGNNYVVGIGVMQLWSDPTKGGSGAGGGGAVARTQMGDGTVRTDELHTPTSAAVEGRRTSWRELVN